LTKLAVPGAGERGSEGEDMARVEVDVDVAVVGAGLAGLMTARELTRAGLSVVVAEARDRVGGRTWSETRLDGTVVDFGGQWVGPTQDRILALAGELGVETFPTWDKGETQRVVQGRSKLTFDMLSELFVELQAMADTLPEDAPWNAPRALEWDSQTFATWLRDRLADPVTLALARLVGTALFSSEPSELSLLHVLAYIRAGRSIGILTSVAGGAQERRFVKGAQEVSIRLAHELGNRVRLGSAVRRIQQFGDHVVIGCDALRVKAKRAVVAVPVAVSGRIDYEPALPGYRAQMVQRMPAGTTIKIHAIYERPFWREANLNGRLLTDEGPVSVVFDNSPQSGERGVLVAFVEGKDARAFCRLPADVRRTRALAVLANFFGPAAAAPLDYVEVNWSDEEWTRGCFGANFAPGGWTAYGFALREPFGLIHWAGAETATIWMNYMDGALRSGERAAAEVIASLQAKRPAEKDARIPAR
jgi:monoamine oxidase